MQPQSTRHTYRLAAWSRTLVMKNSLKAQGFVRTPPPIAALLARWALRTSTDAVLDAGFGEGVFLLESAKRLLSLGTPMRELTPQLHGVDSHPDAVGTLQRTFRSYGLPPDLPGVFVGDLFDSRFPPVDVLIGNPPYVRRWWQKDVDALQVLAEQMPEVGQFSRLTDLSCYFIMYAARFLKPRGRLALIVSDSWLDMRYGTAFKDYLLRSFQVRAMIGFQSQVFPDVLVRPVVILAEKHPEPRDPGPERVAFVSLNGKLPKTIPADPGHLLKAKQTSVSGTVVRMNELQPRHKWTSLLYAPQAYKDLLTHPLMTTLDSLAKVRIGLQSFAKMFYIVPRDTQQRWELEQRWLLPLALSPKDFDRPMLSPETVVRQYVLACDRSKADLVGTRTLQYIDYWERQVLNPRGLARPVIGVQNLPRVRKTRRAPWYNLAYDLARRGTAPVLLPRRIYQRYRVIWNQAGWVAGENFIEVMPHAGVPLEAFLAILNTGVTEMAVRVSAHVYGGGVYNLSPGSVGEVPIIDVRQLPPEVISQLHDAYRRFLRSSGADRSALDAAAMAALGLPDTFAETVRTALGRMQHLSDAILEPIALDTAEGSTWPKDLRLL
ncbi:MAG: N-6 DNA methylase [Candidatus Tectomicrobia bacterium]|nr:N-6 DNA methylase [Candidatus Tectomicrobia bacterium]